MAVSKHFAVLEQMFEESHSPNFNVSRTAALLAVKKCSIATQFSKIEIYLCKTFVSVKRFWPKFQQFEIPLGQEWSTSHTHSTPKWIWIKSSLQSKWHSKPQSRPPKDSKSLEIKILHSRIFFESIFVWDLNSQPLDLKSDVVLLS